MIATAPQAIEALRHKRTGAIKTSRNVAKHTKLLYVTDDLTGLLYHHTIIAWYGERGTLLNTEGWHTRTTWRRIEAFTPARRTFTKHFLRYIETADGPVLYEPGLLLDANGKALNPMLPSRQATIAKAASEWLRRTRDFARKAVATWDSMERHPERGCNRCEQNYLGDDHAAHMAAHIKANELALPLPFCNEGDSGAYKEPGEAIIRTLTRSYTNFLITTAFPLLVEQADPNRSFQFHRQRPIPS